MHRTLATIVLAGSLLACSTPARVNHQGPPALATHFHTYAVVDHPVNATQTLPESASADVHRAMETKGYIRVDEEHADLLVHLTALVGEEVQARGLDPDATLMLGPAVSDPSRARVRQVILVTLEEASTDRVIWVGWATGAITDGSRQETLGNIFARIPRATAGGP